MTQPRFPRGSDEDRVQRVLEHYEAQSDAEALAEDEAAFDVPTENSVLVAAIDVTADISGRSRSVGRGS